tara:strand:- start:1503 stop:3194 length:1692 start_codon:yes stop_codon:yes gene_type:complete
LYKLILISLILLSLVSCAAPEPTRYESTGSPHLITPAVAEPTTTPSPVVPSISPTESPERDPLPAGELWNCDGPDNQFKCSVSTKAIPSEIDKASNEWPLPNKDYAGTREAVASDISSANISDLEIAWTFPLPGTGMFGAAATNPLIIDSKVYLQDLGSNIFSLELETGKPLIEAIYNRPNGGPNGVAVGQGRIFASSSAFGIRSLDSKDGKELWHYNLQRTENEFIDMQPVLFGNNLYVSTKTNYEGNATGMIYALDPDTGGVRWHFDTVDSEDIWGNREINSGGGVWYPPSIDINRGVTYWGVGNPAPWPGTEQFPNGTSRPGPNLYTNSVLALDHTEGELLWYNQIIPHDILDYDFHLSPIVTSINVNGKDTDVLVAGGKNGSVMALDSTSGKQIWETEVGMHENDKLTELPDPPDTVTVFPGHFGGIETPMAVSEGIVYVPVVNLGSKATSQWSETFDFGEGTGELVAIETNNGDVVWSHEFESMVFGAATVVNDLVFTSTFDGMIYAFDKYTGSLLWNYQSPAGINAWPAVSGDTILFPAGVPTETQEPILIAFRLAK